MANSIRKTIVRVAAIATSRHANVCAPIVANWSMICVRVTPMNDVDITETNHLSFCAGYGGIDLGLRRVLPSCRTIAYVEIEAFAIANLVAKMEAGELDQAPVWTDVKTFPAEQFHGLVDIVSGGYPCQPFSAAGKRLGTDDPRHLWPFLRGAVRAIRPSRVFFENVEGHISLGLSTVLSDLDEDGYRATWGIFSAAEVGASHQRKRVFIMANGKCAGLEGHSGNEGQDETGSGRTRPGDQLARAVYHNDSPQDPVNRNSIGKNQEQWGTPTVRLPSRKAETLAKCQKFREKNGRSGVPLYLEEQVNNAEKNWPTPRASGQNDSARKLNKSGKRHAGDDLTTAAKNWAPRSAEP